MKPNILMTPQFKQAFKLLKKKHQNNILKDIIKVIEQLVNFEITTQKSNHPLSDGINDLHIRGDVILLYRYQGAGLIIDLNLLNISDHKELQKNLKLAMKDIANIPFDLEKEKKNLREENFETLSHGQILKRGDLSEYKISDKELEEVKNREIVENMQDKKYIIFNHFNPDTLYFVKNIPDDSWIWDSDYIIEDVTDKHGNCLIENNDENISVGEMGNKTLSDFDKEIIASLKKAIQENPDEDYLCAYTSEDREFCFEKDELPDDLDSMTPFTDFVQDSYVDGDSSSQYQVINLDTEEFGEFGVEIFASDWEDLEESVDNSVELSTAIYDPSDGTYIISKKDWEDWD